MIQLKSQSNCPVCLGRRYKEFLADSFNYPDIPFIRLPIAVCCDCESFYLKSYVIQEEIHKWYGNNYYTNIGLDLNKSKSDARLVHTIRSGLRNLSGIKSIQLNSLIRFIVRPSMLARYPTSLTDTSLPSDTPTLLEVGYGNGYYLSVCHFLGWKCYGVDPSLSNIHDLDKMDIRTFSSIKDVNLHPSSVKHIYSYHALEHIYNIDETVARMKLLLSIDGTIKIGVPVSTGLLPLLFRSHWYDLTVPIHKQIFSLKGLRKLFLRHDLEIKSFRYKSIHETYLATFICAVCNFLAVNPRVTSNIISSRPMYFLGTLLIPMIAILDLLRLGDRIELSVAHKQ